MSIVLHLEPPYNQDELNAAAVLIAALGGRSVPVINSLWEELDREDPNADRPIGSSSAGTDSERGDSSTPYAGDKITIKGEGPIIATLRVPEGALTIDPAAAFGSPLLPAVSAPAAAAAPSPPALNIVTGAELDSEGLPWDGRIYAESKSKISGGKWRQRRNTDQAFVDQVKAELRQAMGASSFAAIAAAAPTAVIPPPPATIVPPPPPATGGPAPTASVAPVATAAPEFGQMLERVVAAQTAGTLTTEAVNAAVAAVGLTTIRDLAHRPDLIPQFELVLG